MELKFNDWTLYLVSGLVWALWHAAYYMVFLPNTYFETISRTNFLLLGCVLMVAWSIMYVEIYRLTKSVWPCVLMHAVEDGVPTLLISTAGIITLTKAGEFWLSPTTGVITTVLFVDSAYGSDRSESRKNRNESCDMKKTLNPDMKCCCI